MSETYSITIGADSIQLVWDAVRQKPIGTSFCFLKPNWLVTAKHVVLENDGTVRSDFVIHIGKDRFVRADILLAHPAIDVVVLQTVTRSGLTPLFPAYLSFTGEKGLFSAGYRPSLSDKEGRKYAIEVNHVPKFQTENWSRGKYQEEVIEFPASHVEPGHSGGPMLGMGGGVVGVVTQTFTREGSPHSFGRATSIMSLLDGLEFRQKW